MRYIYLILVCLIFVACNLRTKDSLSSEDSGRKSIDSILITYLCGDINSSVAIKCEKIAKIQALHPTNDYSLLSEGIVEVIDTFIVDKTILDKINPLLENKKSSINYYNEDARMYITIKYTNNKKDNICLGMDTPHAMFNGEPKMIENELIYLFRAYSGYYKWFSTESLSIFKEYQDFNK